MVAIALEDATKRFRRIDALRGASLSVADGAVHAFLGSNGAGKTINIRFMLGLLPLDAGRVRVLRLDPIVDR